MSFQEPPSSFPPPPYQSHPYQPIPPYTQPRAQWSNVPADQTLDEPCADTSDPSPPTHSLSLAPDSLAQPLSTMRLAPRKGKGGKTKRKGTTTKKRGKAIRTPALPPTSARPSRRRAETPDETYVPIQLKNARGPLLAAPPGSRLEVNDLLILHPPKLSPDAKVDPINQYSSSNAALASFGSGGAAGIGEGYMSRFEMYTCRLCSKTYDGKNARSVARRHLQDKHGVPLALQKRRSRWDFEPERPKTAEMKAKTLQSKRQWAAKNRLHNRLERSFSVYLARFGPAGLVTPCGLRLVAPDMRGASILGRKAFPSGQLNWAHIPAELVEGIKTLRAIEQTPDGAMIDCDEGDETRFEGEDQGAGPSRLIPSASTRTPRSDARSRDNAEGGEVGHRWNNQWHYASATHVDDHALQAAIAQHFASTGEPSHPIPQEGPSQAGSYAYVPQAPDQWYYAEQRLQRMDPDSDWSDLEEDGKRQGEPPAGTVMPWQGDFPNSGQWYAPNGTQLPFAPYNLHQATIAHMGQFQSYVIAGQYGQQMQLPLEGEVVQCKQGAQLANIEEENPIDSILHVQTLQEAMDVDGGELQVPIEAAAAETLLEIHSTPARPDTHIPSSILRHLSDDTPARLSPLRQSTSDPLTLTRSLGASAFKRSESDSKVSFSVAPMKPAPKKLLDAPEINEASRPRPARAMSLIAKAAIGDEKLRPDAMSRSLSFGAGLQGELDDPFAMSPVKPSKKRRSTIASPSPLIKRKKDELLPSIPRHHSQQIYRDSETMSFLEPLKKGIKDSSSGPALAPLAPDIPSSPSRLPLQIVRDRAGNFATPSRPLKSPPKSPARADGVPGSVSRVWLFSSPGNGETAASLGLAPQWIGVGGSWTPGLRGLVSAETPIEKSVKRRMIRKSATGEQENMDESE